MPYGFNGLLKKHSVIRRLTHFRKSGIYPPAVVFFVKIADWEDEIIVLDIIQEIVSTLHSKYSGQTIDNAEVMPAYTIEAYTDELRMYNHFPEREEFVQQ